MGTGVEGLRWGEKIAPKWLVVEPGRAKRVERGWQKRAKKACNGGEEGVKWSHEARMAD